MAGSIKLKMKASLELPITTLKNAKTKMHFPDGMFPFSVFLKIKALDHIAIGLGNLNISVNTAELCRYPLTTGIQTCLISEPG